MRKVIDVLSAALLLPWAPQSAEAQEERALQHVAEVHVKPGGAERFEVDNLTIRRDLGYQPAN